MTNLDNLPDEIRDNVEIIVDAGECKIGVASTIIRVRGENIEVLRQGPIEM